ncbi:MAG TPA: transposase, partial [Acidisoma sp.]|nr:transposase [Acidisoma sp.]
GAELRYLPPYSPDFNPIEQAFAKLKAHLRKAQERSIDTLWQRIGHSPQRRRCRRRRPRGTIRKRGAARVWRRSRSAAKAR